MFPHIIFSQEELHALTSYAYIGDLVEHAGKISIDRFHKLQEEKPHYVLDGVSSDAFYAALESQNVQGIPFDKQQEFLSFASDRQQYKRAVVYDVIHMDNALGLSYEEKILVERSLVIAALFDQLFIEWRKQVIYSDIGLKFKSGELDATTFRKEHNLSIGPFRYGVIVEKEGKYNEEALIVVFPVLIHRIVDELTNMAHDLTLADADIEILEYIEALADFYENDIIANAEYMAKVVDGLWCKIDRDIFPIHAMEVYDDPGKFIVSPEFRLIARDKRFQKTGDKILETKEKLISYLQNTYKGVSSLEASVPLMRKSTIGLYTCIAESGASCVLRPFGENLPNWEEVRVEKGSWIGIWMETAKTRWITVEKILERVLEPESLQRIRIYADNGKLFDYAAIIFVGGHEVAHNAFQASDVMERLTPPHYAKIEETKASFSIFSSLDVNYAMDEIEIVFSYMLGSIIAKLSQFDDTTVQAYVYESIIEMNHFFECNLVTKLENGKYIFNLSKDGISTCINMLKEDMQQIANLYEAGNEVDAQRFIETYFVPSESTQELIAVLEKS